jgi:nucleoside-diphosphate kinase
VKLDCQIFDLGYSFAHIINQQMKIMDMEYTLTIIKPDAMERDLTNAINEFFTNAGINVVAQKEVTFTKEMAEEFYAEHKGKPFFDGLVGYISSAPVVVQVLSGPNAILKTREIMGATNPKDAAEGTVRKVYGISLDKNTIHGSDSPVSAKREISFFFDYDKITE